MEPILFVSILFSMFVALGIGASTLAVSEFFYAISDGKIDTKERGMLGVIYFVLRVAMIGILFTAAVLTFAKNPQFYHVGLTDFALMTFSMLGILYLNAILMTLHLMRSNIGPAFQAGAWYTLGISNAAAGAGFFLSYTGYLLMYAVLFTTFFVVINGLMRWLKNRRIKQL